MITKITERQGSLIAEFIDLKRFTLANVEKVKTELTPILAQEHTHLIFDFQKIEFIDSSAIGCIISLVKTAKKTWRNRQISQHHTQCDGCFRTIATSHDSNHRRRVIIKKEA